jgi:RNA polymerase sigma-70 factor, ECF subfamily
MDKRIVQFEKLYDTYADAIWKHLYYRLGDRERANELMQEVFMKTWQYIVLDKTITHEKAFLYRIATNLYINEIRTNRQMSSLDSLEEAGFDMPDATADATKLADQHELMEHLAMIKESYKTVLVLRYIDDLPVQEIAELLGERETNISMRIKRGIEALKQTYGQPLPTTS